MIYSPEVQAILADLRHIRPDGQATGDTVPRKSGESAVLFSLENDANGAISVYYNAVGAPIFIAIAEFWARYCEEHAGTPPATSQCAVALHLSRSALGLVFIVEDAWQLAVAAAGKKG